MVDHSLEMWSLVLKRVGIIGRSLCLYLVLWRGERYFEVVDTSARMVLFDSAGRLDRRPYACTAWILCTPIAYLLQDLAWVSRIARGTVRKSDQVVLEEAISDQK